MSDKSQPTQGDWTLRPENGPMHATIHAGGKTVAIFKRLPNPADGPLIAAAPDHALVARAFATAGARWEGWSGLKGEFCVDGMRYSTELDDFGVPVVTPAMRAAIAKATGA